MTQQPKALRLADELEMWTQGEPAAAELRRLHALCGEWENKAATWLASPEAAKRLDGYRELAQRLNAAESVNAQLLEALEFIADRQDLMFAECSDAEEIIEVARAAIAAAKGGA
jgi:hypothetical protein